MTSQLRTNTSFTLNNYGVVWVTSTTLLSGSTQFWTNYYGGLIRLDGDAQLTNDNSITNLGTINCGGNLTMAGASTITTKNILTVAGDYLNSGGTFTNYGKFQTTGSITFNSGLAIINNYCRMIAEGGIHNTTGFVNNYGFMWAKASRGLGDIINSGTLTNGPNATVKSVTLNNTGTINGAGKLYLTGYTTTTNLGTTGVAGITSDTIRIYDVSRNNPLTIYDNQTGIVNPNVIYKVFAAPDTNAFYFSGCAEEVLNFITLAVNWNYFHVTIPDNTPSLIWSAQYDRGTVYEIQRSYDGSNFYKIKDQIVVNPQSEYNFDDEHVNLNSSIVYYRIKAIEPNGSQKFSEIRTVKFSNKTGVSMQAAPNPFTSEFRINYQTTEKGMISIRIYNLNGQQQFLRNVAVNNSLNNISIVEAANFARGMYIIQVTRDNKLIISEKIIKN